MHNPSKPGSVRVFVTAGSLPLLRHFDYVDDLVDDVFRGDVLCLGLVGNPNSVAQNIVYHSTDVFRDHIASALDKCITFGGGGQVDGTTGRGPKTD